jgi:peptidyl-prolyl cis-trans isomerase C
LARIPALLLIIATLAFGAACNKSASSGAASSGPAQSSADKPSPAATPSPALGVPPKPVPQTLPDVLARVNNQPVSKSDFEMLVKNIELKNRAPIPPDRRDEILRALLDQLVEYTLLKQEAEARNVQVTDAEVEQQVSAMKQQNGGDAGCKKGLAERNMTIERLRADTRAQMAISKMLETQVAAATPATDAEAKVFYEKNPDKFKRGESVRASHILIRVSEQASEQEKKKARAQIDAVLKRAKAGEDFAVLAREHSQDGSAAQGGDLSYFVKGQMVQPFDQVAFSLKPHEISDVVTTQFGYHIIKVVDHKPAGSVPLNEVAENVKKYLSDQKKQETAQAFINQIKQKSKIEVLI